MPSMQVDDRHSSTVKLPSDQQTKFIIHPEQKSYQPVIVFGYVVLLSILIHNFISQLSFLLLKIKINDKRQRFDRTLVIILSEW